MQTMAQRKSNSPASKGSARPVPGTKTGPGARPPARKPGKSIVNQKQTPWGLIITTVAIVIFAVGIVSFAVLHGKSSPAKTQSAGADVSSCTKMIGTNPTTYLNELVCAKDIPGVKFYPTASRTHVLTTVDYPQSPPVGGNHSPVWGDCTGKVYSEPIANENAVHMLEHGAIWITYNPSTLPASQLTLLENRVNGQDREALTPYPGLKTPLSLQSWGYQLFLKSATDPRIDKFINALRYNPKTTPEYPITCSDPEFNPAESTPGHPQES
jgi:hypothetical protein